MRSMRSMRGTEFFMSQPPAFDSPLVFDPPRNRMKKKPTAQRSLPPLNHDHNLRQIQVLLSESFVRLEEFGRLQTLMEEVIGVWPKKRHTDSLMAPRTSQRQARAITSSSSSRLCVPCVLCVVDLFSA
jgi:hypothetical protein